MPLGYLLKKVNRKPAPPVYSTDWFSHHIVNWMEWLAHYQHQPDLLFLEIGSYEGRSTRWLLDNILTHARSQIICIDTWRGSMEHVEWKNNMNMVQKNFLHNIHPHRKKVKCCIGTSQEIIRNKPAVFRSGSFDFIYIDGSHAASDVLEDAVYSFRLLKSGGLMVFDDYTWDYYPDAKLNPRMAIDAWLACFEGQYQLLHQQQQVCVQKR